MFARHGLRGARVQDITRLAQVNERMIYHHFGSKDGLYLAVLEQFRHELASALAPALLASAGMSPYAGWRHVIEALYDALGSRVAGATLFVHEWLEVEQDSAVVPQPGQWPVQLRHLYEQGQRDGVFPVGRSFELAYAIALSSLIGAMLSLPWFVGGLRVSGLGGLDARSVRGHVVDQIVDGLSGPAGPLRP